MKELSIEEKAKLYDEAMKVAIVAHKDEDRHLKATLERIFPELKESEDGQHRKWILEYLYDGLRKSDEQFKGQFKCAIAWLEKQGGEQNLTLPKWKYKKDNTPLLRDSIILNKYGCVAKSPSGALVSDVWVIDYAELAKLPKEEIEKQGEQKSDWGEDDENVAEDIEEAIINYWHGDTLDILLNWLKSLKQRYTWKPSDEQMKAFEHFVRSIGESGYASPYENNTKLLYSLLNDLKKLKGE